MISGAVGTGAAAASASPSADPAPSAPSAPSTPAAPSVTHGESVTKDADGKYRVYTWQTGTVTQKSGSSITVRSSDGTTWTWAINADTDVRRKSVAVGDTVMVGGPRDGESRTAARITDPLNFDKLHNRMKELRKQMQDLRGSLPDRPDAPDLSKDFPEPPKLP
ncbi:hypothetical protein GCM10010411_02280 [Actinomadura fulvescens]|uniref:DUF5666 domain-containing protein n=1 Tax=Actinomadura fulvescens TaxID=46160 RepID=A0ABN3PAA7_9ACTN